MEPETLEVSAGEAKLIDPNQMCHLVLKDGTIVTIVDDPEPEPIPEVTSCPSCTCKCNYQQQRNLRSSRASEGEIVEERNNYRLFVSGETEPIGCDENCKCICHKPPVVVQKVELPPPKKRVCPICEDVESKAKNNLRSQKPSGICPNCSHCPHCYEKKYEQTQVQYTPSLCPLHSQRPQNYQNMNMDNYKFTEIQGTSGKKYKKRK